MQEETEGYVLRLLVCTNRWCDCVSGLHRQISDTSATLSLERHKRSAHAGNNQETCIEAAGRNYKTDTAIDGSSFLRSSSELIRGVLSSAPSIRQAAGKNSTRSQGAACLGPIRPT